MVTINANLDLKTYEILDTARLNETLADLTDEDLGITFVVREEEFHNEVWQDEGKSYMRVVLPYDEVLDTVNLNALIFQYLYQELEKLEWLNVQALQHDLKEKWQLENEEDF